MACAAMNKEIPLGDSVANSNASDPDLNKAIASVEAPIDQDDETGGVGLNLTDDGAGMDRDLDPNAIADPNDDMYGA